MEKMMEELPVAEMVPVGSYNASGVCVFKRLVFLPLKRGVSTFICPPLRRILLSEMTCLAIAGLRFEGPIHEFSSGCGLLEDIIDVILNVKQIVLKGKIHKPVVAKLSYKGPGIITALDIKLPDGVEVVDSSQYIATATTSKVIEMEFLIKSGAGYSLNHNINGSAPEYDLEGFMKLDASYMPVTRFNFFVESVISEEPFPEFESLVIEISTNGSITPEDAILEAFKKLQKKFLIFEKVVLDGFTVHSKFTLPHAYSKKKRRATFTRRRRKKKRTKRERELREVDELALISIEQLELAVRANKILHEHSVETLSNLVAYSRDDLLALKGVGVKAVTEIEVKLFEFVKSQSDGRIKRLILGSKLAQTSVFGGGRIRGSSR